MPSPGGTIVLESALNRYDDSRPEAGARTEGPAHISDTAGSLTRRMHEASEVAVLRDENKKLGPGERRDVPVLRSRHDLADGEYVMTRGAQGHDDAAVCTLVSEEAQVVKLRVPYDDWYRVP